MNPYQVSAFLCHIADKIQASKKPSKILVANDIKKIISAMATSMDEAHEAVSKTITNGCKVDSRVIFSDTDGDNKEAVVLKIGLENWEGRPSALIRTEDGRELIRPISKLQEVR